MGLPGKPGSMDEVHMGSMKGQKGDQGEKGDAEGPLRGAEGRAGPRSDRFCRSVR